LISIIHRQLHGEPASEREHRPNQADKAKITQPRRRFETMRLLNTTTLRVEQAKSEIVANEKPPLKYAILSHTWGEDEVIFQDMQAEVQKDSPRFSKIVKSCELAKNDGYDYIWIDTCCIDKSSSAELSEAINSMYLWYSKAAICYAYLSDVESREAEDPELVFWSFKKSRWFTRGWTLQELIAPSDMVFLSKDWRKVGDKDRFRSLLSEITSIDPDVLRDHSARSRISVARKMSWAAKRSTTRVEDRAYSLLGIFDVNMPLPDLGIGYFGRTQGGAEWLPGN